MTVPLASGTTRPDQLRLSVLGPLAVQVAGRPVALGPLKQRLVLAALLTSPNTPLPVGLLTDTVWPHEPPRTARKNLQVYVSSLRTLLGPGGRDRLVHAYGGYVLRVTEEEVDHLRFRSLARAGRRAAAAGAPAASRLLRDALDLWRGPALQDLHHSPPLAAEAGRMDAQRVSVLEDWAETETAQGNAAGVVEEIVDAAERHPLRERLQAACMGALLECGRRTEALAVYDNHRRLLAGELGLEPGRALSTLHRSVLAQDRRTTVPAVPTGRPARKPVGTVLPADVRDFVGRSDELHGLLGVLAREDGRVAVISGPAGAGKTSLAVRAGHLLADRFPDGRLMVSLTGASGRCRPASDVLAELAGLAGCPLPDPLVPEQAAAVWRAHLAARRMLVVLDDAPGEGPVRALLPGTGGSSVVVCARGGLAGLSPVDRVAVPPLRMDEALGLLGRIMGTGRLHTDPDAARRICEACGFLPLAVKVSAMRLSVLPHLPLAEYAERLAAPESVLEELVAGDISVAARLDSMWHGLTEQARQALARLAVLARSSLFTLAEAQAALGCSEPLALRVVEDLIAAGAVTSPVVEMTAHCALYSVPRLTGLHARARSAAAARETAGARAPGVANGSPVPG